jgi:hypothetical protein
VSPSNGIAFVGLAALVLGGLYLWRYVTEGDATETTNARSLIGASKLTNPIKYMIAWGAGFLILSLLATVAPGVAGGLALMIIITGIAANLGYANKTVSTLVATKPTAVTPEEKTAAIKLVKGLNSSSIITTPLKPFVNGF